MKNIGQNNAKGSKGFGSWLWEFPLSACCYEPGLGPDIKEVVPPDQTECLFPNLQGAKSRMQRRKLGKDRPYVHIPLIYFLQLGATSYC